MVQSDYIKFLDRLAGVTGNKTLIEAVKDGYVTVQGGESHTEKTVAERYGDGNTYYADGASATGFYAISDYEPIGFAILTNDTETLKALHDEPEALQSELTSDDKVFNYNYAGWEWVGDDENGNERMKFSFDRQYRQEFVEDWERVVGKADNEEAIRLMLEFVPDFWPCPVDFQNAFAKGYDKGILSKMLHNYSDAVEGDKLQISEYCDMDADEVFSFLDGGDAPAEPAAKVESIDGDGRWDIPSVLANAVMKSCNLSRENAESEIRACVSEIHSWMDQGVDCGSQTGYGDTYYGEQLRGLGLDSDYEMAFEELCNNTYGSHESETGGDDTEPAADPFSSRASKILNVTHTDLDGAVSAIVAGSFYPKSRVVQGNYKGSKEYDEAMREIADAADWYDGILFTDFSPDKDMVDEIVKLGKPYLVIDHHQTCQQFDNGLGNYVVDTGMCGALLCLKYLEGRLGECNDDLQYLCEVTDDHDRWVRKNVPLSDDLNTVFCELGFDTFRDHYADGLADGIRDDDRKLLAKHAAEVDEYLNGLSGRSLPCNGIMLYDCDKFTSDINVKLQDKYDWIVFEHDGDVDGMAKLSFRTSRKDINLGAILKSFGLGGGGHPGAAGQNIEKNGADRFVDKVAERISLAGEEL